jgi:hypothetical protein
MYNSLFRISDESICGMDFHSGLQKNWASNTAINTKPEAHPCFSGPHIGPWPSTHFQGLEPPTITTFKSSVIQKASGIWRHGCAGFCSDLLANNMLIYCYHLLSQGKWLKNVINYNILKPSEATCLAISVYKENIGKQQ